MGLAQAGMTEQGYREKRKNSGCEKRELGFQGWNDNLHPFLIYPPGLSVKLQPQKAHNGACAGTHLYLPSSPLASELVTH